MFVGVQLVFGFCLILFGLSETSSLCLKHLFNCNFCNWFVSLLLLICSSVFFHAPFLFLILR